jgi:hypothetical protein
VTTALHCVSVQPAGTLNWKPWTWKLRQNSTSVHAGTAESLYTAVPTARRPPGASKAVQVRMKEQLQSVHSRTNSSPARCVPPLLLDEPPKGRRCRRLEGCCTGLQVLPPPAGTGTLAYGQLRRSVLLLVAGASQWRWCWMQEQTDAQQGRHARRQHNDDPTQYRCACRNSCSLDKAQHKHTGQAACLQL